MLLSSVTGAAGIIIDGGALKNLQQLNPDQRALVLEHIEFARRLARQFFRERVKGDLDYEDYEGAAMLGLCDAARRFESERGLPFQHYCGVRIRGAMIDVLRSIGSLPRMYFAREEAAEAEIQNQREKSDLPMAYSVEELVAVVNSSAVLNMQVHKGVGLGDLPQLSYLFANTPEETLLQQDGRRHLRQLVDEALPPKERSVVSQYYFEGRLISDFDEIQTGSSKSWLSRLHKKGISRLRKALKNRPEVNMALVETGL